MRLLREAHSREIFTAGLSLNQPGLFAASNVTAPEYKWMPARFPERKSRGFHQGLLRSAFALYITAGSERPERQAQCSVPGVTTVAPGGTCAPANLPSFN